MVYKDMRHLTRKQFLKEIALQELDILGRVTAATGIVGTGMLASAGILYGHTKVVSQLIAPTSNIFDTEFSYNLDNITPHLFYLSLPFFIPLQIKTAVDLYRGRNGLGDIFEKEFSFSSH